VFSFRNAFLVAASQKIDFDTLKIENALFCDEMENFLHEHCRHPMGHRRVQYVLILTNYDMI
jgi:hypothetical protein